MNIYPGSRTAIHTYQIPSDNALCVKYGTLVDVVVAIVRIYIFGNVMISESLINIMNGVGSIQHRYHTDSLGTDGGRQ